MNVGEEVLATSSEKLVRKRFRLPYSTIRKLEALAAKQHGSTSEVLTQATNLFFIKDDETLESMDLMELVSVRLKETLESTCRARRKLSQSLQVLSPVQD